MQLIQQAAKDVFIASEEELLAAENEARCRRKLTLVTTPSDDWSGLLTPSQRRHLEGCLAVLTYIRVPACAYSNILRSHTHILSRHSSTHHPPTRSDLPHEKGNNSVDFCEVTYNLMVCFFGCVSGKSMNGGGCGSGLDKGSKWQ